MTPRSQAAARLRVEPAAWLAPISVVLGYLAATGFEVQSPGYPLALAVRAHGSLIVLAPIGAAASSWSAGRLRRARWTQRTWVRPPARLLAASVTATTAVQLLAYLVVRAAVAVVSDAPVPVEPAVTAVAVAVLSGWSALGFLAGWWVRTEFAVPATLAGSYLAMVGPVATEPLWVRHLTGAYLGCCLQDQVMAPGALVGAAVAGVGAVVAASLLVRPSSWRHVLAAVTVATVAAATAVHLVDGYGVDPTEPRGGPLVCTGSDPVVCTWPERRDELAPARDLVARTLDRWADAGLATPDVLTPGPEPGVAQIDEARPSARSLLWDLPRPATDDTVATTLAAAALPDPDCSSMWASELWNLRSVAVAELAVIGGGDPARAGQALWPELHPMWQTLHLVAETRRAAWLGAMVRALATCNRPPPIPEHGR